ncbi:5454_t:CDS:1 [Cetraspora pellucida]|uniref:5454_t:CDS:1 n=1 Tax=Cetraspora pellucida TaxID=1433469 RepID=A0ACA9P120_9GLOM|nr:5454_t:CDS:1 [Cetraspora pellucida]
MFQPNNMKAPSFADYIKSNSVSNTTNYEKGKGTTKQSGNEKQQNKSANKTNEKEISELRKKITKKNNEIGKLEKEIFKKNSELSNSKTEIEKQYMTKNLEMMRKLKTKLVKEKIALLKNSLKLGDTSTNLLAKKLIDESNIKELEGQNMPYDTTKTTKGKSIKDKSISKGKQQQNLNYFQKQLKACFNTK